MARLTLSALIALLILWVPASAQIGDGQFIQDGSVTSGSAVLTSSSGKFASGAVGKSVQCGTGSGANIIFDTTVASFADSNHLVLAINSPATASALLCQWGTDNTAAINAAIAALPNGSGEVPCLPSGYYLARSINLTRRNSVTFCGETGGANNVNPTAAGPGIGTVIVPMDAYYPLIDLTCAGAPRLRELQIGSTLSPVRGLVGIFIAQCPTNSATGPLLDRVSTIGSWGVAGLVVYGVQAGVIRDSGYWNYGINVIGAFFSRENNYGITSAYTTVATGEQGLGQWLFQSVEFHQWVPGGGATGGYAVRMRGMQSSTWINCLFDASSTAGIMVAELSSSGSPNNRHVFIGNTFYNEQAPQAVHAIFVPSGTFSAVTMIGNGFVTSGAIISGNMQYSGFQTP